jgi:hypothetical protein
VMPYIVVEKRPNGSEMFVINNKGSLSHTGTPKKFLAKETAKEIAAMWAQINANCDQNAKMFVRKVD